MLPLINKSSTNIIPTTQDNLMTVNFENVGCETLSDVQP